jgi:hypothetical protein
MSGGHLSLACAAPERRPLEEVGNKTGLGEVVTCTFEQEATENGATLEATGTATVVRIR